jgi:pimeloyl-ACP methyl ester carboxylesterase
MFGTRFMACVATDSLLRAWRLGPDLIARRLCLPTRFLAAKLLAATVMVVMVAGCTATPAERGSAAEEIARKGGLARSSLRSEGFLLTAWSRIADPQAQTHVYVEGDGYAWATATDPSNDPTPINPLALRLAAVDDAPNVLYLARPCQFRPAGTRDSCDPSFWTSRRFAEVVVAALDGAIDRVLPPTASPPYPQDPTPRRRLTLIGYSGGGGIAVLLAARRTDVAAVVSVAGNIAHGAWTSHHKVSPLRGSLDPIDSAGRLASVPQLHLVGAKDRIVPRLVADTFVRRSPPDNCIRVVSIGDASHDVGWLENWPALLDRVPDCPRADHPTALPDPAH